MPEPLMALWQTGAKRCLMSHPTDIPPFVVELYEGSALLSRSLFDDHNSACAHAVEALRLALPGSD
jgi:hypothetical protein